MAPAFSKEAILTGEVDHFCLVCENYMRSEHEIAAHIIKPDHRKRLENTDYVDKYKDDRIRKIKKWYFCEFCNVLLSTLSKVGLHVKEDNHVEVKTSKIIERKGDFVVLLDNVAITEESWHGLSDNNCILCDCEFEDRVVHKKEPTHIINLIKIKVKCFGNIVYRRIEDTVHCLTCNESVANVNNHLKESKHVELFEECKQMLSKNEVSPNKINFTQYIIEKESIVDEKKDDNIKKNADEKEYTKKKKDANKENDTKENKDAHQKKDADEKKNINDKKYGDKKKKPNEEKKETDGKKDVNKKKDGNEKKDIVTRLENIKVSEIPGITTKETIKTFDDEKTDCDPKFDRHVRQALRAEDYIYRNSNGIFCCILCDWEINASEIKIHLDSEHHQTILKMHKNRGKELNTVKSNVSNDTTNDNTDIIDSIETLQKNNININFETRTATCKTCSKILEFKFQIIENHIQEHKKPVLKKESGTTPILFEKDECAKPMDSGTLLTNPEVENGPENDKENGELKPTKEKDENLRKLAEEHELFHNSDAKIVHCPKCKKDVPYSIKNINEHVFGITHINNDQLATSSKKKTKGIETAKKNNTKKCELQKVPTTLLLENITVAENDGFCFLIINEKYCVSLASFMFTAKVDLNVFRCLVCERNFKNEDSAIHFIQEKHHRIIKESSLIIHPDGDFIREVSTELFHCGHCDIIESSWDRMEDHLKLTSHRESKKCSLWLLAHFLSDIERIRLQREVQNDFFNSLHNIVLFK